MGQIKIKMKVQNRRGKKQIGVEANDIFAFSFFPVLFFLSFFAFSVLLFKTVE